MAVRDSDLIIGVVDANDRERGLDAVEEETTVLCNEKREILYVLVSENDASSPARCPETLHLE
jgi:septum formation inhibitor-activating ATPase MinD